MKCGNHLRVRVHANTASVSGLCVGLTWEHGPGTCANSISLSSFSKTKSWSRRYAERIWGEFFILVRRTLGKLPANFSANFDGEFLIATFSPLFFQGFRPPKKFTPKNSHPELSAFLSNFTLLNPKLIHGDFLLTGETNRLGGKKQVLKRRVWVPKGRIPKVLQNLSSAKPCFSGKANRQILLREIKLRVLSATLILSKNSRVLVARSRLKSARSRLESAHLG